MREFVGLFHVLPKNTKILPKNEMQMLIKVNKIE